MAQNRHDVAAERAKKAAEALHQAAAAFQDTRLQAPSTKKLAGDLLKKFRQANQAMMASEDIFGFDDIFDPPPDLIAKEMKVVAEGLTSAAHAVERSGGRRSNEVIENLRRLNRMLASSETIVAAFSYATDPVPDRPKPERPGDITGRK